MENIAEVDHDGATDKMILIFLFSFQVQCEYETFIKFLLSYILQYAEGKYELKLS